MRHLGWLQPGGLPVERGPQRDTPPGGETDDSNPDPSAQAPLFEGQQGVAQARAEAISERHRRDHPRRRRSEITPTTILDRATGRGDLVLRRQTGHARLIVCTDVSSRG